MYFLWLIDLFSTLFRCFVHIDIDKQEYYNLSLNETFSDVLEYNRHKVISVVSGLLMVKAKSVEELVFNGGNFITESPDGEVLSVGYLFTNIWKTSKTKKHSSVTVTLICLCHWPEQGPHLSNHV